MDGLKICAVVAAVGAYLVYIAYGAGILGFLLRL